MGPKQAQAMHAVGHACYRCVVSSATRETARSALLRHRQKGSSSLPTLKPKGWQYKQASIVTDRFAVLWHRNRLKLTTHIETERLAMPALNQRLALTWARAEGPSAAPFATKEAEQDAPTPAGLLGRPTPTGRHGKNKCHTTTGIRARDLVVVLMRARR